MRKLLSLLFIIPTLAFADTASEAIQRAIDAINNYDFTTAAKEIATARKLDKKSELTDSIEDATRRAELGSQLIGNVEKIVILDSINVPTDHFFTRYKIPRSMGRILAPEDIPMPGIEDLAAMAYANEAEDFLIWSQPDSIGTLRIVEATRLTDGTWSEPRYTPEFLNDGGDADFPYLSADGSMLYFASDGEESLGGYDIFVTSRDTEDGTYLAPRNLGMPFNSPFDDFMLVTDEENGVGWWATDRNQIPDYLTIYLYLLPKERDNIGEDADAVAAARILSYKATWPEEADFSELIERINNIDPENEDTPDFDLPMPGGKVLHKYEELKNDKVVLMMKDYQELFETQEEDLDRLAELRKKYAANRGNRSIIKRILELEEITEKRSILLENKLSEIYKIER